MTPAVYDYEGDPVYVNVPLRNIRPTKHSRQGTYWGHGKEQRWIDAKDLQSFRLLVSKEGDIVMGEGANIVHTTLLHVLQRAGIEGISTKDCILYGHAEYAKTEVALGGHVYWKHSDFEPGRPPTNETEVAQALRDRLPERWADFVAGVEVSPTFRVAMYLTATPQEFRVPTASLLRTTGPDHA